MSKRAKFWLSLIARRPGKRSTCARRPWRRLKRSMSASSVARVQRRSRSGKPESAWAVARAEEARAALDRANAMEVGVAITRAQLLVVERDSRVAAALLLDARKKLALLNAGSRAEDIAEAKARRDGAAAFLGEGKTDLDQCSVRAPAAGTVKILVTVGQFVSTYAPATLIQLTLDAT
jgi:multidrug resistance efflux pump